MTPCSKNSNVCHKVAFYFQSGHRTGLEGEHRGPHKADKKPLESLFPLDLVCVCCLREGNKRTNKKLSQFYDKVHSLDSCRTGRTSSELMLKHHKCCVCSDMQAGDGPQWRSITVPSLWWDWTRVLLWEAAFGSLQSEQLSVLCLFLSVPSASWQTGN